MCSYTVYTIRRTEYDRLSQQQLSCLSAYYFSVRYFSSHVRGHKRVLLRATNNHHHILYGSVPKIMRSIQWKRDWKLSTTIRPRLRPLFSYFVKVVIDDVRLCCMTAHKHCSHDNVISRMPRGRLDDALSHSHQKNI